MKPKVREPETESEVDTEELLSTLQDVPPPISEERNTQSLLQLSDDTEQHDTISSGPLTPNSQHLPSGASASSLTRQTRGSAHRKLDFNDLENPTTASILKKTDSPQKSTALSVSFSTKMTKNSTGSSLIPTPHIPEASIPHHVNKLEKVLEGVKLNFERYSRLSAAGTPSLPTRLALNEVFLEEIAQKLKNLESEKLFEVLEVELYQKAHLQRKLDAAVDESAKFEERLAVLETLLEKQRQNFSQVENSVRDLVSDFSRKEHQRIQLCERTIAENVNLQENLNLARNFAQSSSKSCLELEEKLSATSEELGRERNQTKLLKHQIDSLTQQVERVSKQRDATSEKLSGLETQRTAWISKEKELLEELKRLEKSLKEAGVESTKLKTELSSEKSSRRVLMEQQERNFGVKLEDVAVQFQKDQDLLRMKLHTEKEMEVKRLSKELEEVKERSRLKIADLEKSRDSAVNRVRELESGFEQRKKALCAQIQDKLAHKYSELLAEFGSPQGSTYGPQHPEPTSLAEEFLLQLQGARPFPTPREPDGSGHVSPFWGAVPGQEQRKQQLQTYLKQVLTKSSQAPGGHHPLDPNAC